MPRLKDQCALITGGTTGIGIETARRFVAEGGRVAVTCLSSPPTRATSAQANLAHTVRDAFGQLDLLVVNAGIAPPRRLCFP